MKKTTNYATLTITLLVMFLSLSCKKDKKENLKPSLKQVSQAPEKYGFKKINTSSSSLETKTLGANTLKNFDVYRNEELNAIYMTRHSSIKAVTSTISTQYQFFSYNCIISNSITPYQTPILIADDSGDKGDFGVVYENYIKDFLAYGAIGGGTASNTWWAADEGYFNLDYLRLDNETGDGWAYQSVFDDAIANAPDGWIAKVFL